MGLTTTMHKLFHLHRLNGVGLIITPTSQRGKQKGQLLAKVKAKVI